MAISYSYTYYVQMAIPHVGKQRGTSSIHGESPWMSVAT